MDCTELLITERDGDESLVARPTGRISVDFSIEDGEQIRAALFKICFRAAGIMIVLGGRNVEYDMITRSAEGLEKML